MAGDIDLMNVFEASMDGRYFDEDTFDYKFFLSNAQEIVEEHIESGSKWIYRQWRDARVWDRYVDRQDKQIDKHGGIESECEIDMERDELDKQTDQKGRHRERVWYT